MKNLLFVLLFFALKTSSQSVEGYWYGKADVVNYGSANNYLVELIIKQNKSVVSGVINYYFKNTFRSQPVKGNYNSSTRKLTLSNLPITYYGSTIKFDVDCIMDVLLTLRSAQVGSNLSGRFISKPAYRITCPQLDVSLKLDKDAGDKDSIMFAIKSFKETYQVWSPSESDTLIAATVIQRPIENFVVTKQYKERENIITQDILVDSDSLKIDFYDNGEIDGDSISVFFNNQLLASSQKLGSKSIHLNIILDKAKEINELTMFADNLGKIPPNTALMLIYDGKKRYEARLSSTLDKNATVRIRRKK